MEINTQFWGDSSTWRKDTFFWSTNETYTDDNIAWYNANNRTFETNTNIQINTPIDYSICYAAHAAAEKMPLADIAVYDYTATKVLEQTENAGFFFCDIPNTSTSRNYISSWNALKNNTTADINVSSVKRWLQQARTTYNDATNTNLPLRPVVRFGIKSFFFDVRVVLIKNDYTARQVLWLKDLENNISQYSAGWHIEECYGRVWSYSGKTGNNFNNFSQNIRSKYSNIGEGSIAINKDLKIIGSDKVINNYCAFLSNGFIPIFGTGINNINNYRNLGHYGILINKRNSTYYQYYDESYALCMASAADLGVSVYATTDDYGFPVYLLNPKMSITAENCEKLRKGAAAYGLFFTDNDPAPLLADSTNTNRWINENMYCGVLDEDGIGHGEYTKGIYNVTNDVFNYDNSSNSNYDSNSEVDTNTYSNSSYFKFVDLGNIGCKRYALSAISVNSLVGDLWSLLGTFSQDNFDNFTQKVQAGFLVTNPIDSIVSLLCFPFIVPNIGTDEPIKLGKYDMTARGTPVTRATYTINFRGVPLFPRFGNCYLDYEPYTNYEIYVPFCGTIPLKAADILGHTLNVKLIVDLYTGSCTGYVLADDLVIETITGTVAITIPITGMDSTTINSQIVNANLNYKSSLYAAGSAIGSMVSIGGLVNALSNPADAVNKIAQSQIADERAEYELKHIPTQPHMIGASSPALGWCCDTIARVMIYYPTGDVITDEKPPSLKDLTTYGHITGFVTLDNAKLSNYSGFTVATNAILNFAATTTEKEMIKNALNGGIFI